MIRHASFTDIPALVEVFKDGHRRSRFAQFGMDLVELKKMLTGALARRESRGPGGACLFLAAHDGILTGFIFGLLERCYHVGVPLMAGDVYLYVTEAGKPEDAAGLVDAYTKWGLANPRVVAVRLGHTDFIEGARAPDALYARMGYRKIGAVFEYERNSGT